MSAKTSIEWVRGADGAQGQTWNPIRGCSKISPGCNSCYAATFAARFSDEGQPYHRLAKRNPANWTGELLIIEREFLRPIRRKIPTTYFVNSMSDLFHERMPEEVIDRIFAVMSLCPHHTFQILTKRAERMAAYASDPSRPFKVAKAADSIVVASAAASMAPATRQIPGLEMYYATNAGEIYTTHGSGHCVWCGHSFDGPQDARFCGQRCKSASHYAASRGNNPEPAGRIMRRVYPESGEQGHLRVWIIGGRRELVHRLVLATFDREPRRGEQGCHRDGNPQNCHIANLYWGLQADNWADRKRHGNHRSHQKLSTAEVEEVRSRIARGEPAERVARDFKISGTQARNIARGDQWATTSTLEWPLPGVWLGVSVENQEYADKRIPLLLKTPAAVRFLSCEPLLGPIDLERAHRTRDKLPNWPAPTRADWVIVGGESGHDSRPMHPDWARSIRDQCQAAGVPFFFKQWGCWREADIKTPQEFMAMKKKAWTWLDRNGDSGFTFGTESRACMERVGKTLAGRILDGRTWDEMPRREEVLA